MKRIKTILSFALIAMVMALTSCGNKAGNPAEEFAASLDKIAEQIKSFKSEAEFQNVQPEIDAAGKIVTDNADYKLTDNDRQAIKEALGNYYGTAMKKSFELANQQIKEDQLALLINMATSSIDNITTLGELHNPSNANSNSGLIESVEMESDGNDSLVWEQAVKIK